jgi:hypothetical protein
MIRTSTFWRTVTSGLIATFVMAMIAFVQGGFGLPVIDVGHILKEAFNHVHDTNPYDILWGNAAYYIIGVLLAFIWVLFLQRRTPGNWLVQGILFGVAISIVSGMIVAPLVSLSAGDSFGIFYTDTWIPGRILVAGLIMHIAYGIILTLCLKYAGVNGIDTD